MSTLYPGSLQIPAMLISKAPKKEKLLAELESKKYIGQPKKDGAFYQLEKTDDGQVYLFSRSKSKKTGELSEKIDHVPHLREWADQIPNGTILIGEIYYPGGKSNDVTKIMGSLANKAIERQSGEYGLIHYYIHDMIRYDKHSLLDVDFEHRYSELCEYIDIDCENPEWLEVATSFTGYGMLDTVQRLLDNGEEGAVIKLKSGLYVPSKRPTYNFKIKEQVDDIDLVIMTLLEPEYLYSGKEADTWQYKNAEGQLITKAAYYGWTGAFQLGAYRDGQLVPVGRVASGITDEMKKDSAEHPEKYIGQVAEIQAMSLDGVNCTLRHPRFMRLRPDKPAQDCKLEEIFSLK